MRLPDLPAGVYRHYKGHLYLVFGYGHDSNYEGRIIVHYIGLELDDAHTGPRLASRTAVSNDPGVEAWWDIVHFDDGSKCLHVRGRNTPGRYDGWCCNAGFPIKPRYEYIGPSWDGKR